MKKILLILTLILSFSLAGYSQSGWNTTLHSNWESPTVVGQYNDIWGYADSLGGEYAIMGSSWGTHFINVTNPDSIYEIQRIAGWNTGATWRDFKTYDHYAFGVSDDANSSLQIFDLQYLPDSVVKIYDHDSLSRSTHNIFISGSRLYLISNKGTHPSTGAYDNAVRVVDISNPLAPTTLGVFNDPAYNIAHDAYVRNDTVFLSVMFSTTRKGLQVLDFTNPTNPINIGSLTNYPDMGLNHASWGSADKNTLVMVDETHGSAIKVVDISNLSNITTVSTMETHPNSIAHNPFILDSLAIVSHYHEGVQIWSINDPANPVHVGYYDTDTTIGGGSNYGGYNGCWGVYPFLPSKNIIASDRGNGLYVISMDWLNQPPPPPPSHSWNMTLHDIWESPAPGAYYNDCWGYVDSAGREYGIFGSNRGTHFLDVTNPDTIVHIASFDGRTLNTVWRDFKVWEHYGFAVSEGSGSLQIFDLQYLPDSVVKIYDHDSLSQGTHNIQMWRSELYLISNGTPSGYDAMRVVDVSDPYNPSTKAIFNGFGSGGASVHDIYVWHDTVYFSGTISGQHGLHALNFRSPQFPSLIGSLTNYPGKGYNHSSWGSLDRKTLVMADETHGSPLKVVDISDHANMTTLATMQTFPGAIPHNPFVVDTLAFVSYYHDGVQVWSIADPSNPRHVGYYDTDTTVGNGSNYSGYEGCWGVYPFFPSGTIIASDQQNGFFTLTLDGWVPPVTPPLPVAIGRVQNKKAFKVYPNPSSGTINLELDNSFGNNPTIHLLDQTGKSIFSRKLGNETMVQNLAFPSELKGIFFLRVIGPNSTQTQKIILR